MQVDGGRFEGTFKNDRPNGMGKWTSPDKKLTLEGEFQNDMPNGQII